MLVKIGHSAANFLGNVTDASIPQKLPIIETSVHISLFPKEFWICLPDSDHFHPLNRDHTNQGYYTFRVLRFTCCCTDSKTGYYRTLRRATTPLGLTCCCTDSKTGYYRTLRRATTTLGFTCCCTDSKTG